MSPSSNQEVSPQVTSIPLRNGLQDPRMPVDCCEAPSVARHKHPIVSPDQMSTFQNREDHCDSNMLFVDSPARRAHSRPYSPAAATAGPSQESQPRHGPPVPKKDKETQASSHRKPTSKPKRRSRSRSLARKKKAETVKPPP